jgi:hypothetical protein
VREQTHENKSVINIFEKHNMHNGANGVKGTLDWFRKEDDRPLAQLIVRAADDLTQCEENLRLLARGIRRDLDAMETSLAAGFNLNQAGILQRSGPELDTMAARRQYLAEQLNALCWALTKKEVKV